MVNSPKIEIRNLYKIFGSDPKTALEKVKAGMGKEALLNDTGHVLGLQNISMDIHESAITVVMGLSGSGKSTLIRHINRLIEPTDGQVLIDGEDALLLDQDELREKRRTDMSMVFQKFALLPHRTVLDNSALPLEVRGVSKSERHAEAQVWINRVGLGGFEKHYPYQLSGGMQQRVGLARALTSNSDIMLMDEAFSALDPLIRSDMQKLLLELHVELKKTIIFITHDLDEAVRVGHRIAIMRDGKVIQIGTPEEIVISPADEYVADFVKGISRLKVVQAKSIMQSVEAYEKKNGKLWDDLESVQENELLSRVIEKSKSKDKPLVVRNSNSQVIGAITQADLLKAVVEGGDE